MGYFDTPRGHEGLASIFWPMKVPRILVSPKGDDTRPRNEKCSPPPLHQIHLKKVSITGELTHRPKILQTATPSLRQPFLYTSEIFCSVPRPTAHPDQHPQTAILAYESSNVPPGFQFKKAFFIPKYWNLLVLNSIKLKSSSTNYYDNNKNRVPTRSSESHIFYVSYRTLQPQIYRQIAYVPGLTLLKLEYKNHTSVQG